MRLGITIAVGLLVAACGKRTSGTTLTSEAKQNKGLPACGGSVSLFAPGEEVRTGQLAMQAAVAKLDRLEHGIRVELADAKSFVIGLHADLPPPLAVGDKVDVSIECGPVGWNVSDCSGTVLRDGVLIAFDRLPDAKFGWKIQRGPRLSRSTHANYGPTDTYAFTFTVGGVSATSPLEGCIELRTPQGTYRVRGGDIEHHDPRAPDSSDYGYFAAIRVGP